MPGNPAAFSSPHSFSSGNPYLFCNSAQPVETLARGSGLKIATYQLNQTNQRPAPGLIGRPGHTSSRGRKMRKDLLGSASLAKTAAMSTVVAAIALLAGCSTTGQIAGETMEQATAPLTCTNKAECDAWWARAQVWVSNHSEYKLQTVTDSIIQTDGPSGGKRALAYQITKTPSNEGTATIGFAAHCDNMLGCEPNPWKAGADFKQFVRGRPSQMGTPGGATATGNALPPVSPAPPSRPMPQNLPVQPMPPTLQNQPGQSGQDLTPQ
jgi:hypothetical protein